MKRESRLRKLHVESLERRVMLDGNVSASVAGGVLLITGDAKSNVITISSPTTGGSGGTTFPPGTLLITPDATTSIDNGAPGASLQVSGVTFGAKIVLGSGNDSLSFQDSTGLVGPVSIQTGAGSDQIQATDFTFSKISVAAQGNCAIDLSNTTVQQSLALQGGQGSNTATFEDDIIGVPPASGAPLTLVSLSSTNFGLSLERTSVGRSIQASSDKRGMSTSLDTCTVGGGITVTSAGSLSFTSTGSTCSAACSLKFDSSAASSPASVDMEQGSLGGGLSIQGRGAMTASIKKYDFTREGITVDNSASSARSSIDETDVDCGGSCTVSATAPLDFSATGLTAGSCNLQFTNVKHQPSESNVNLQSLTIAGGLVVTAQDAASLSFTVSPPSPSQITSAQISVDNSDLSAASPPATLDIEDVVASGVMSVACRGAFDVTGSSLQASDMYLKWAAVQNASSETTSLDDITVTGGLSVTSSVAQQMTLEHIKSTYDTLLVSDAGDNRSSISVSDMTADGAVSITAHSAADVSVTGVQASSLSLVLDGTQSHDAAEIVGLDNIALSGGLTITSSAAQDLSVESVSLNFTKIIMKYSGAARSSVGIGDMDADGRLDISCAGATDTTVQGVQASDCSLTLGGSNGSSVVENTSFDNIALTGGLTITSSAAQDLSVESVSLNFTKIIMKYSGAARSSVGIGDMDADGRLDISCAGATDTTVQGVQASDCSLTLGGSNGSSVVENTSFDNIALTGGLTITSSAAQDLSVESVSLNFTKIIMKYSGAARSSVGIGDMDADGRLDISCAGATDTTVQGVQASDCSLTLGGSNGSSVVENTSFDNIALTGGLTITSSAAQDLSVESVSLNFTKIIMKYSGAARSSVGIGDMDADGRLDISCAGATDTTVQGVQASDFSLALGGIKGAMVTESTDLDGIAVTGGLSVTCGTAQQMTASSLNFGTYMKWRVADVDGGASSIAIGDVNGDGVLDIACATPSNVSVDNVQAGSMLFELDGIKGSSLVEDTSLTGITLTGGLSVTCSAVQSMSLDGFQGQSIYMKLGNSSLLSRSSVSVADMDLDGSMNVVTTGAIDFQAASGAIHAPGTGNFSLSFAALFGQTSPSSLSIDDMTLDGNVSVTSVGGLTFNVGQGSNSSTGAVGTSSGLQANGLSLTVSNAAGAKPMPTQAMLTDLVLASLYMQTGAGDDTVSIADSQVTGRVYLNGGLGNDTLILDNTDFSLVSNPQEISWETVDVM